MKTDFFEYEQFFDSVMLCKNAVFEQAGVMPNRIDLPFNLYFCLISSLRELFDFDGFILEKWEGLFVFVHFRNCEQFIVRFDDEAS